MTNYSFGEIGIYKHEIFYFFKEILGDKFEEVDLKILEDNIPELEEELSTARYPGWENDHIWIPSEEYKYEDAVCMESRLEIAPKTLKTFLKEKHKLEIKK